MLDNDNDENYDDNEGEDDCDEDDPPQTLQGRETVDHFIGVTCGSLQSERISKVQYVSLVTRLLPSLTQSITHC